MEPKLIIEADAQGNVKPEPMPEEDVLTPFPDGKIFAHCDALKKNGSRVIVDGSGKPFAIAKNSFIADIICKGAHMFFMEFAKHIEKAKLAEAAASKAIIT